MWNIFIIDNIIDDILLSCLKFVDFCMLWIHDKEGKDVRFSIFFNFPIPDAGFRVRLPDSRNFPIDAIPTFPDTDVLEIFRSRTTLISTNQIPSRYLSNQSN